MQSLLQTGRFPSYIDLYKHLVGFQAPTEKPRARIFEADWAGLSTLRSVPYVTVRDDEDWAYVKMIYPDSDPNYDDYIKLYVPVQEEHISKIAHTLFKFLLSCKDRFDCKVARKYRYDNLCVWIKPKELEPVIEFLQPIQDKLYPAPLFCPEYKNVGISRELHSSFNEVIASTLYLYLAKAQDPHLASYIGFLEETWSCEKDYSYSKFDKEVVLKSLKCILHNHCPVTSPEYQITSILRGRRF